MNDHQTWLRGCSTALVTPFTADGNLDEAAFKALVERQIHGGVKMLTPCGTTGECATLDEDEHLRVIELCIEVVKGRAKVMAGVGCNSTRETVARSKAAVELGADCLLVVAPYYNKPTQAGLTAHFSAVAEVAPNTPIVLYNVPGRTACNILPATTVALAKARPNVVAMKEACGDFAQIAELIDLCPDDFVVLSGDDSTTIAMIALGAAGVVSVTSNEAPAEMSNMVEAALAGDYDKARALQSKLLPLMDANFVESSPGGAKAALQMMGLCEDHLRLPLVPVGAATRDALRHALQHVGLA